MKIGVLGGTFDPPHIGHLIIAEEARVRLGLAKVVFVPSGRPWLKVTRRVSAARHRLAMVRLAIASNPFFELSTADVDRAGPSYTVDTLADLCAQAGPRGRLYFIMGCDALLDLPRWHDPARLVRMCRLVVARRPEYDVPDLAFLDREVAPGASRRVILLDRPLVGVSASGLRRRVARGQSIRYWAPDAVEEYIREHGLYAATGGARRQGSPWEGSVHMQRVKVCVFDIDGTLSDGFFIVNFPKMLCKRRAFVLAENQRIQKIYNSFKAGEPYEGKLLKYKQFARELVNAFGRGIRGQSKARIMELGEEYVTQSSEGFPFARGLVELVKKKGYRPIAVSGSPYEVILPFAKNIGIDEIYATRYKHKDGRFTGEVEQNCAIDTEKKKITDQYFAEHDIDTTASAGFGDSEHDLAFLKPVGYPVAVKPNKKLRKSAEDQMAQKSKRWLILDDDKKVLGEVDSYLP